MSEIKVAGKYSQLTPLEKAMALNKQDGWINTLAGLGKRADKIRRSSFSDTGVLTDEQLTNLWTGEGLGKKIVAAIADDMTRNWITIGGDPSKKILKELDRLDAQSTFNLAIKWARLYRGSLILVGAEDGRELTKALGENIKTISWLKVYPAPRVKISQENIIIDPKSEYFEDVEMFPIQRMDGTEFKAHRTRCILFKGEPVPHTGSSSISFDQRYWGLSILNSIWSRLQNYSSIEQGIANLMLEVNIGKFKLSNLAEMISENNSDALYNRMETINASKSILNAVLIGDTEDYMRDSANLTGIPETLDRFMMNLSAVCEIPVTRLFGRSPAGQNSTGESDLRNYYDKVQASQNNQLLKPLQDLVMLINKYLKVDTNEEDAQELTVEFNSVWEPTQEELVDMRKKQSETDKVYLDSGALDPDEIRTMRFAGGYSFDMNLPEEDAERTPATTTPTEEI